jgi:hypothetical protein
MKSRKPLLLLDIDGVLLPFSLLNGYQQIFVDNELVSLNPDLRKWFNYWEDNFQIIWASNRLSQGNEIFLSHLSHKLSAIDLSKSSQKIKLTNENNKTNKLALIKQYLNENQLDNQPLIWIEDELFQDAFNWAKTRTAKTLLIRTNSNRGLNKQQFQETVTFINELVR